MALGALLVADDQTLLQVQGDRVIANCPPALTGLIEARGLGLLRAPMQPDAVVCLVVDLDQTEAARLPEWRTTRLLGLLVPLVLRGDAPHFPVAVRHYVLHGRAG